MQETLSLTTARIVGGHDPSTWAQAAILKPFSYTEDNALGDLFAVVYVNRNDDEDAAFFGKSLLDNLQNAYFAKQSLTKIEALKHTLMQAEETLQHEKERLNTASVLTCVLVGNHVLVGKIGDGAISLFRKDQLFSLIPKSKLITVITGKLELKDYLILGTDSFFEHAYPTHEVFNGENDATEVAAILSPLLLSLPQNGDIAAFVIACCQSTQEQAEVMDNPNNTEAPAFEGVKPYPARETQVMPPLIVPPSQSAMVEHPLDNMPVVIAPSLVQTTSNSLLHLPKLMKRKLPQLYIMKEKRNIPGRYSSSENIKHGILQKSILQSGKVKKILSTLAIILLIASLGFGIIQYHNRQKTANAKSLYNSAWQSYNKALPIAQTDPSQAKTLLQSAKDSIVKAARADPAVSAPTDLSAKIDQEINTILAITAVKDPQTLVDLQLIKDNFHGSRINYADNVFLAVDPQTPTILKLNPQTHDGTVASGGTKLAQFIGADGLNNAIIAVGQNGIYTINSQTGVATQFIAKDAVWGTIADLATFNNNIYLFDSAKGQIWKYSSTGNGFTTAKNVIGYTDTDALVGGEELVIDGAFWVVTPQGIVVVSQGIPAKYTIDGLPTPLGNKLRITTTLDTTNLFILDAANGRVVVATKDGRYVTELTSQVFSKVLDITLNPAQKQLYLLTQDKILTIPVTL